MPLKQGATHILVKHANLVVYRQRGWTPRIQIDLDSQIEQALLAAEKAGMR